jgi:hypothetical protein
MRAKADGTPLPSVATKAAAPVTGPDSQPGTPGFRIGVWKGSSDASTAVAQGAGARRSTGGGGSSGDGDGAELSRQGSSVQFWEENKKLQARVEVLR